MTSHTSTSKERFCPELKAIVESLEKQKANALGVGDGKKVCAILGCSPSQLDNKRRAGKIPSFLDGAKRVYPLLPVLDHLIEQAIASFSPNGEPLRARHPTGQFRPGHTPPTSTPKQREALKRGNALRIARAQARRAVVST